MYLQSRLQHAWWPWSRQTDGAPIIPMAHVEGWGRSTLYQRIRYYTLRSQSGSDIILNYDLRNGA